MVGVVGSSPIAPTKFGRENKHLAETPSAFFLVVPKKYQKAGPCCRCAVAGQSHDAHHSSGTPPSAGRVVAVESFASTRWRPTYRMQRCPPGCQPTNWQSPAKTPDTPVPEIEQARRSDRSNSGSRPRWTLERLRSRGCTKPANVPVAMAASPSVPFGFPGHVASSKSSSMSCLRESEDRAAIRSLASPVVVRQVQAGPESDSEHEAEGTRNNQASLMLDHRAAALAVDDAREDVAVVQAHRRSGPVVVSCW